MHSEQYDFTKGKSTTDAGAKFLRHIYGAWDKSQIAIGVFCDLSKALCRPSNPFINLNRYGMRDAALDLIASYLHQRVQTVNVMDFH